jgi:hypothetical protein
MIEITRRIISSMALASTALLVAGCVTGEQPAPYSPRYSYAELPSDNGRPVTALMPDSCAWTAEAQAAGVLPAGCANAYNLQRMVESERDLVEGRQMGPAPAQPAAIAANWYLQGKVRASAEPSTQDIIPQIAR